MATLAHEPLAPVAGIPAARCFQALSSAPLCPAAEREAARATAHQQHAAVRPRPTRLARQFRRARRADYRQLLTSAAAGGAARAAGHDGGHNSPPMSRSRFRRRSSQPGIRSGRRRAGRWLAVLASAACLAGGSALAAPAFEDSIAQRALACTGCHGKEGRAASDGYYPRIAGKPAGYLYNQLLNFRDGRRSYALMTRLLEHLSDDYLREFAGYFSGLELPYPAPQPAAVGAKTLERGRALVMEGDASRGVPACAECHGKALTGVAPSIPGLLGLPRDYLNAQFGAWRVGQRRAQAPDCMAQVARLVEADDVAALTGWLAAQPVPVPARPAEARPGPMPIPCGGVPGR